MSSIKQKMTILPSLEIDFEQEFVLKIKKNNKVLSELLISVKSLDFQLNSGKSEVYLIVENPDSINNQSLLIETGIKLLEHGI